MYILVYMYNFVDSLVIIDFTLVIIINNVLVLTWQRVLPLGYSTEYVNEEKMITGI